MTTPTAEASPWRYCTTCPKDDNFWPAEAFTFSSGSGGWRICNACWTERYIRVRGKCEHCGRYLKTWRRRDDPEGTRVLHRSCQKALEPPPEPKPKGRPVKNHDLCVVCDERARRYSKKRSWVVHARCVPDLPPTLLKEYLDCKWPHRAFFGRKPKVERR